MNTVVEMLPGADLIDNVAVWTPEVERLVNAAAMQIRLDQPGMTVSGMQRNGKSYALRALAQALEEQVGFPVATKLWIIPADPVKTTRVFLQERMVQSGLTGFLHRDMAVLRTRLIQQIADGARSVQAKRLCILIDEAQNLDPNEYKLLVYLHNEWERVGLRPFMLLAGQPELKKLTLDWISERAQEMVGRFSTLSHEFHGIRLEDLDEVLKGFDDESDGKEQTAAFKTNSQAYEEGWRVCNLAPLIRQAVRTVAAKQNVSQEVRLPMQYLRTCLLSLLYTIMQKRLAPESVSEAHAIDCVKASNFASVLQHYVGRSPAESRTAEAVQ